MDKVKGTKIDYMNSWNLAKNENNDKVDFENHKVRETTFLNTINK